MIRPWRPMTMPEISNRGELDVRLASDLPDKIFIIEEMARNRVV